MFFFFTKTYCKYLSVIVLVLKQKSVEILRQSEETIYFFLFLFLTLMKYNDFVDTILEFIGYTSLK